LLFEGAGFKRTRVYNPNASMTRRSQQFEIMAVTPPRLSLDSIKRAAFRLMSQSGAVRRLMISSTRYGRLAALHWNAWNYTHAHRHYLKIDPFAIVQINPRHVRRWILGTDKPLITWKKLGAVEGGDWDVRVEPFVELIPPASIYQHFVEGKPWTETPLYKVMSAAIERGEVKWSCTTVTDLERRIEEIDRLYATIERVGYRSQKELIAKRRSDDPMSHMQFYSESQRAIDEIVVSVGRTGELLFVRGGSQHRLAIAQTQNIPLVPARILVRHVEWQRFRDTVARFVDTALGGEVPHQVSHPDLPLPHRHDSAAWLEILSSHMRADAGSLLEAGAGLSAYFSHALTDRGIACLALECDARKAEVMVRIRDAVGSEFEVATDLSGVGGGEDAYDVAVVLDDFYASCSDAGTIVDNVAALARSARYQVFVSAERVEGTRYRFAEHEIELDVLEARLSNLGFILGRTAETPSDGCVLLEFVRSRT
jgi:hypothetical protein